MRSALQETRPIHPHLHIDDVSQNLPARLLTITEVAEQLGLGRTKVYSLIKQEGLPIMRFGRSVRISQGDLSVWLTNRKSPGNACKRHDSSEDTL